MRETSGRTMCTVPSGRSTRWKSARTLCIAGRGTGELGEAEGYRLRVVVLLGGQAPQRGRVQPAREKDAHLDVGDQVGVHRASRRVPDEVVRLDGTKLDSR
jgi:hypothetical protein